MAIFHCRIKIISRAKGRSAVGSAAYRAGQNITNGYDGVKHNYTRRGGVVYTEILLPVYAPREFSDRKILWNSVELAEKDSRAQTAREIEVGLPCELTLSENKTLLHEYIQENFVKEGMCADIAIHDKGDGNPHAHIMLTMRPLNKDGSWGAKSKKEYCLDKKGNRVRLKSGEWKSRKVDITCWNSRENALKWRESWANNINRELERKGIPERVDHRSYEEQGIDKTPTKHIGVAAQKMEQRGIRTDRGHINREIERKNVQTQEKMKELLSIKQEEKVGIDRIPGRAGDIKGKTAQIRQLNNYIKNYNDGAEKAAEKLKKLAVWKRADRQRLEEEIRMTEELKGRCIKELESLMPTDESHIMQNDSDRLLKRIEKTQKKTGERRVVHKAEDGHESE